MDCIVGDDHSVRLSSPAEDGIEDSHPFHLGFMAQFFVEDDRPLRHGSSFNKQETVGRYDCYP